MKYLPLLLLVGCVHTLPPENYRITETYHVCDPVCHKVTVTHP